MKSKENYTNCLVSIIVPVYNAEAYIKRCLDSIICQTYKNIDIILVDDGSSDSSGIICENYALIDKRIKVIHKNNGGPSEARNVGLSICKGDYIGFIDADDYVDEHFVEYLLKNNKDYDILMCRTRRKKGDSYYVPRPFDYPAVQILINGKEAFKMLCEEKIDCSCCDKLFNRKLLDCLCFQVGKVNEELSVLTSAFSCSSSVFYIKDALYTYCSNPNSITTSTFNKSQFDKVYNSYENMKLVKRWSKDLQGYSKCYFIKQCFYLYLKLIFDSSLKSKYLDDYAFIKKSLLNNYFSMWFSSLFSFKTKLSISYSLIFPRFFIYKHRKKQK